MPTAKFDWDAFLAKGHSLAKYAPHQVIFAQGSTADAIFYIKSGRVKVTVVSHQGKEAVIGLLGAGDFFGEGCLNGQTIRVTSAVAIEDSVVARIAKEIALKTLREEPEFADLFMRYLLDRNRRMEADLADQLFNSSEKRLARLLLILANFGKDEVSEPISPKISQETLAEMVGTTRSRISYFMNKFRRLGLIDYNGHLIVNRSLLNFVLHDQEVLPSEAEQDG